MTVSTSTTRWNFTGNGVTTAFNVGRVQRTTDLKVSLIASGVETVKVLNTDYTVSGAGISGSATVNFVSPPGSGVSVVIRRDMGLLQETSFKNQGAFFPELHEDALDRVVMFVQQLGDLLSRALRRPDTTGDNYAAGARRITGLADGVDPADAVTLSQLSAMAISGAPTSIEPTYIQEDPALQTVTGSVDNLVLTGKDAQETFVLNPTSGTTITGIAAKAVGEARRIHLFNANASNSITLKHEHASSANSNRMYLPGATDVVIAPYRSVMLVYVTSLSRWVAGVSP